ncbi:methionine aminopeptidase [Streptomyces sp. HB132]|nr:methionine aminopeptidase [Streptomyces sp. HB132]
MPGPLNGWAGDSAVGFTAGRPRTEDVRLSGTAFAALDAGIAAADAGERIGDLAHAIGTGRRGAGHGTPGRARYRQVGARGPVRLDRGTPLRHVMVPAIEPMPIVGGQYVFHADPDGWTLRASDGNRLAHAEHTGPSPMTAPHPDGAPTLRTQAPPANFRASSSPALTAAAGLSIGEALEFLKRM